MKRKPRHKQPISLAKFFVLALLFATLVAFGFYQSGLATEILARISPPVSYQPITLAPARFIKLPTSPFLEAGRRPDGGFDSELMEARFRAAGLSQRQALDVALHLLPLSATVIAVKDPAFEDALIKEAVDSASYLRATYPAQYKALSKSPLPLDYRPTDGWIDFKVKMLLMAATHDIHALPLPNSQKMQQARLNVLDAVEGAGLRALRIAPADLSDGPTLNALASRIREANQGLQRATGWKGGVLGLGGRVELTVGSPEYDAQGVTASTFKSDRLCMTGLSYSLGHEWFHALDFVVARKALAAPSHETLSAQMAPFRIIRNQTLTTAWRQARSSMEKAAPVWYRARQVKALTSFAPYWLLDTEKMAFAFQAHAAKTSHTLSLPEPLETYNELHPYMYPSPQEIEKQSVAWGELFEALAPLNLTSGAQASSETRTAMLSAVDSNP